MSNTLMGLGTLGVRFSAGQRKVDHDPRSRPFGSKGTAPLDINPDPAYRAGGDPTLTFRSGEAWKEPRRGI